MDRANNPKVNGIHAPVIMMLLRGTPGAHRDEIVAHSKIHLQINPNF
jgi:hypothetical protein